MGGDSIYDNVDEKSLMAKGDSSLVRFGGNFSPLLTPRQKESISTLQAVIKSSTSHPDRCLVS
jgi:hypothetical protein